MHNTPALAAPLSAAQVQAGIAIYDYVEWFKIADGVLADVNRSSASSTRLKVLAINRFYATRVDEDKATAHVVAFMSQPLPPNDVDLVEQLATVPTMPRKSGAPGYLSVFASKFAHFFIRDSVVILDKFAEKRVAHHFGFAWRDENEPGRYTTFVNNVASLRGLCACTAPVRDLDKYLWVAGEYADYVTNPNRTDVNSDLAHVFRTRPASLVPHLNVLL